jgi:hypothetical protein
VVKFEECIVDDEIVPLEPLEEVADDGEPVDHSRIESEEDAPVTAYYLWLPFLLTFCFGFAKFPRSVWRNFLENGLVRNLLGSGAEVAVITQNFIDFRPRYAKYHFYFGFCEFLNMCMVILSLFKHNAE